MFHEWKHSCIKNHCKGKQKIRISKKRVCFFQNRLLIILWLKRLLFAFFHLGFQIGKYIKVAQ